MSSAPLGRIAMLGALLLYSTLAQHSPQKSTADLVELVRPAVVQVAVKINNPLFAKRLPPSLEQYFRGQPILVVGTGFFVNAVGDLVTASHVANGVQIPGRPPEMGVQQIIQMLEANGIDATAMIGVSIPNVDRPNLKIESNTDMFPAAFVAADGEHDVAVFHATVNPFTHMVRIFGGPGAVGLPQGKPKFLPLGLARPRDGDEIFACGFPFGDPGLVTTFGSIASAWKTQSLLTAEGLVPIETYWVDLRVNPGNSGGPVFRIRDHGVLGMVVESRGSLGSVVPSKYIAEFLKAHNIQWHAATP